MSVCSWGLYCIGRSHERHRQDWALALSAIWRPQTIWNIGNWHIPENISTQACRKAMASAAEDSKNDMNPCLTLTAPQAVVALN